MRSAFYENKTAPYQMFASHTLTDAPHLHKEIEIVYVREGGVMAHADKNCEFIAKDRLFISFPNQIHFYESCQAGDYYVLILLPDMFFGLKNTLRGMVPESNVVPCAQTLLPYIERAFAAFGEYRDAIVAGHLTLMMSELLGLLPLRKSLVSDNSTLHNILDFCNRNVSGALSLETVAESLHLSRFYISRLLTRELNMGFSDFVSLLRVNRACDLLADTDKKIADVSEDAGFATIRSFNRAFARHMNMTPLQYRKTLRDAESGERK